MNIREKIERLRRIFQPQERIVTVTLDLSGQAAALEATRVFVKDLALDSLVPRTAPPSSRAELRELTARIQAFLLADVPAGTRGLFLCAGPDLWETLPIPFRLSNALHLGNTPYLPPLLAALQSAPRSYVVRCQGRRAELGELDHGLWRELDHWELPEEAADPQRQLTGGTPASPNGPQRASTGVGGGKRDRFLQHLESEFSHLQKQLVRRLLSLPPGPPEVRMIYFGDAEHFGEFRRQLPASLRDRADYLGMPPEGPSELRHKVDAELTRQAEERLGNLIREYEDRLDQRYLIARGPGEVLQSRGRGRLALLFLDAEDPVWGLRCLACAALQEGSEGDCSLCGGRTTRTSLTQELASHSLSHPPLPLSFVRHPSDWLRKQGGMAALLSPKAIYAKK